MFLEFVSESLGHLFMFLRLFLKPSPSLDTATPSPNPSSSLATMYPFDDTCKQDSSTLIMKSILYIVSYWI